MNQYNKKLSIVINHHQTPEVLKMCIDSSKEKLRDIDYEIIVTDSGTNEETLNLMKHYPDVTFLPEHEDIGFSKSVNRGIKKASGQFLFIINADIIIRESTDMPKMIGFYESHPDVGIMGPKLLNIDGSVQASFFREYTPLTILAKRTFVGKTRLGKRSVAKLVYDDIKPKGIFDPDWLMGSAFLISKEKLEKIGGGLDERYFMYMEDSDMCRQLKKAGYRVVYYPEIVMTHHHKRESHSGRGAFDLLTNWLTRVHVASYIKYIWKWNIEQPFKNKLSHE